MVRRFARSRRTADTRTYHQAFQSRTFRGSREASSIAAVGTFRFSHVGRSRVAWRRGGRCETCGTLVVRETELRVKVRRSRCSNTAVSLLERQFVIGALWGKTRKAVKLECAVRAAASCFPTQVTTCLWETILIGILRQVHLLILEDER